MRTNTQIAIKSAAGTIYFIEDSGGLKQGFDLLIENRGPAADAELTVQWDNNEYVCSAGTIDRGESTARVYIPDVRRPTQMTFTITSSGKTSQLAIDHNPQRHWTVHIVQFSHHDLGYTDLPTNVLREFCTFYDDALRFCTETDHFPDDSKFRYMIEQGWSLLYYLDHRPPEVREEMMRRIKERRIEVNAFIGNEVTELLGPEEMVRMLYPVFALKRKYGIPVACAEHNDIPGISWGVAAAMAGAGIKYFTPALPDYFRWGPHFHTFWDEDLIVPGGIPHAFHWEAPDGDKTLFWYDGQGAGGPVDVTLSDLPAYLQRLDENEYPYDVLRYMVRGADRDNSHTRVEFAYTARQWNSRWAYPRLISSINAAFFVELEKQLADDTPTWRGELPGTDYSSAASCTAYPSSLNRVTHDQLLAAERFATIASQITPYTYPRDAIDEAYHCTLMNDEHAWGLAHPTGPGQDACIAQHCEFAYRSAALAHDVLTKAVNEIADRITRDDDGYHAVVFNTLSRPRTDLATAPARPMGPCSRPSKPDPLRRGDPSGQPVAYYAYPVSNRSQVRIPSELIENGLEVIDLSTGSKVPHEIYELPNERAPVPYAPYRYSLGQHSRGEKQEVRFVAEDVPPMGYKLYRFVPAKRSAPRGGVRVGSHTLENKFYKLRLDPKSGAIASIYDKQLRRELIDRRAPHRANQIVLRSSITSETATSAAASIEKGRQGPVSGSLIVTTQAPGFPQITQEIVLYSDIKRIDIANRVLKDSTAHLETFFAFPFAFDRPNFKYEGSLCAIEPLVDQFPGSNSEYYAVQHWADVSDSDCGVTLASIDAPMMQFGGNWPLYISQAHHGYRPPNFDHPFHTKADVDKGHIYSFVLLNNYTTNFTPAQTGDLLFRYSITSHGGEGGARDFGYNVSLPLIHAAVSDKCEGDLPSSSSFCQIEPDNVILLALKRAEDNNGLIIRLMETQGTDTQAVITLPFISINTAHETNLVEENRHLIPITQHTAKVNIKAWGTATVRVTS